MIQNYTPNNNIVFSIVREWYSLRCFFDNGTFFHVLELLSNAREKIGLTILPLKTHNEYSTVSLNHAGCRNGGMGERKLLHNSCKIPYKICSK